MEIHLEQVQKPKEIKIKNGRMLGKGVSAPWQPQRDADPCHGLGLGTTHVRTGPGLNPFSKQQAGWFLHAIYLHGSVWGAFYTQFIYSALFEGVGTARGASG